MDNPFLQQAIQLAVTKSADGRHGPFGAVIVKDEKIIARGWNHVVASCDPTAHAEVMAIRQACENLGTHDLSGCTVFASCEPCPMCLAAIYWARIEKIVFAASRQDAADAGFDDAFLYEEMGRSWQNRKIKSVQRLEKQGKAVFEGWIDNPEKVAY
jgi:tRNA(Arg) A34 adenosine deaminase TadA